MKPIHTIIATSIILNLALFIYAKPFAPRPRAVPAGIQVKKNGAQAAPALNLKTIPPGQLMQKLTAMGFPPDTIKTLVKKRINEIYYSKLISYYGYEDPRYWRVPQYSINRETRINLFEAHRENEELLAKLLGADYDAPKPEALRQKYGGMPDEKLRALAEIDDKHDKQNRAFSEKVQKSGKATKDDEAEYKSMQRQQREELSKLLTPGELFEYDVRENSYSLQEDTKLLAVTEQEFRDMFAVYQKADTRDDSDAPSEFATQKERNDYKEAQLRQILGDDRYADYQQAKNPAYEKLNLIVQRLDLPFSAAREVVSVQNDLVKRAAAIDTDATLTNAGRAEQYTALAQEARERITQTLGERGYSAYRENSKNWIQTLEAGKTPARPRK
jgi:hypothetical protein